MAKPNIRQAIIAQALRDDPVDAKRHTEPRSPAPPPTTAEPSITATRQASRVGKACVAGYYAPEVRRQLRKLSADRDTTIQALLGEAINDLFAKHGLPEIVEPE